MRIEAGDTFVESPQCACGREATVYVEVHAANECRPDRRTVSGMKCQLCHARNLRRIANIIRWGGTTCSTCGLHIVSLSDMIVIQCPLTKAQ